MHKIYFNRALLTGLLALALTSANPAQAQDPALMTLALTDGSAFRNAGTNWKIVGDVSASLDQNGVINASPGTGVLANQPDAQNKVNLLTTMEHGDLDVEFDFMMATHSNSGFYLQGRYEIQLNDSWGVKIPTYGDCGGIYKRRELPSGRLYDGHAPRMNVCKAPGLWQHMAISFQAPRFDANGKKLTNAKVLSIVMNGATLHENVELTGPTGGPISEQEVALGPIMIQGDHGAVAFRNIKYKNYTGKPAQLAAVKYKVYYGANEKAFERIPDFSKLKPDAEGTSRELTWEVSKNPNNFGLLLNTALKTTTPGRYTFTFGHGGQAQLMVNGKELYARRGAASIDLPAGDIPIEIRLAKSESGQEPALGLMVEGPDFRRTALHSSGSMPVRPPDDPIVIDARESTITRCFMDYRKENKLVKRIVHSVNVGGPDGLHYTFDMDNAALAQAWRGDFLNAEPMWDDRGDGSARPLGALQIFNDAPLFAQLNDMNQVWADTLPNASAFRPRGYDIAAGNLPVFRYVFYGAEIEDAIRPEDSGKMLTRELTVKNPPTNLYCRLAEAQTITEVGANTYAVDGKAYYVRVLDGKPTLRTVNGRQELLVPAGGKVKYSVMF
ncbi:MAG: DUF1080 domain-containing protein [Cytophagaceae bacterium]|nr:DUF1080 domain-containing protein [Cytophagaceae bacterium]